MKRIGYISLISISMVVYILVFAFGANGSSKVSAQLNTSPHWQNVHVSTLEVANNWAYQRMSVFDGFLYASTANNDHGGEVWRTDNGVRWSRVNMDGFGSNANVAVLVGETHSGFLYAGTHNTTTGTEIWRCVECDGYDWEQVVFNGFGDENNSTTERIVIYSDMIYATVSNPVTGVEIWVSDSGESGSWVQCNSDGFGDARNTASFAAIEHNGYLYVATAQWEAWGNKTQTGVEVWRATNCNNWEQINEDGFGDNKNVSPWLTVFNGDLYILLFNDVTGAQLWRCDSCDNPTNWAQVISDGFGDQNNKGGGFMIQYDGQLYVGTSNESTGTEIMLSDNGDNWAQINIDGFGNSGNQDTWSGEVYKGHLFLGTRNEETGGQIRQLVSNQSSLSLPIGGYIEVSVIGIGGPEDWTGCTGDFGLFSPASNRIYPNYLYNYNLPFPLRPHFQTNDELVFELTTYPGDVCDVDTYYSSDTNRAFVTQPFTNTWIISWEDWDDNDFNDIIIQMDFQPAFLDLPYDYTGSNISLESRDYEFPDSIGKVNSYFDHQYPTYCNLPNTGGCSSSDSKAVNFFGYDGNPAIQDQPPYNVAYNGHDGIDFALSSGTQILAAASGEVVGARYDNCTGNTVEIEHSAGYVTKYYHLSNMQVITGSQVTRESINDPNSIIGVVGGTGSCSGNPHLHFTVLNPSAVEVDPYGWNPRQDAAWYGKDDPWETYNIITNNLEAKSNYLWIDKIVNAIVLSPTIPMDITSTSNEIVVSFPTGVSSTPLRIEVAETLQALSVSGLENINAFSIEGFTTGDVSVTTLEKPFSIVVNVSTSSGVPRFLRWNNLQSTWESMPTEWDAVTRQARTSSSELGSFILVKSDSIFLPLIIH